MGRRKNANPRRNESSHGRGEMEQLGERTAAAAAAASRLDSNDNATPVRLPTVERQVKEDTKMPPPLKKRRIILLSDDEEDDETPVFPMEVSVDDEAHSKKEEEVTIETNGGDESRWTTIRLSQSAASVTTKCTSSSNSQWTIRRYRLFQIQLLSQDGVELDACSLLTADGAAKLLQYCESCCSMEKSTIDLSSAVAAVVDGTLRLDCRLHVESHSPGLPALDVRLSLTERAFEACSVDRLPFDRRPSSTKYQTATQLHRALAGLFPHSVIADVLQSQKTTQSCCPPITAKTVYDLIDNVKLQQYEAAGGYDNKPMSIPGLVPTLRPYQEAAVKWMLQREQCSNATEHSEWELAWVVLADAPQHDGAQMDNRTSGGELLEYREIVSLPEWKRKAKRNEASSAVMFCPFGCFLVKGTADAYMATLNSFLSGGDGSEWANPTGGILADSMGLGKTVEVLALLLANRRPNVLGCLQVPTNDMPVIEEEKKDSNDSVEMFEQKDLVQVNKWTDRFGACVCGSSSSFRSCLSLVLCRSCHQPMHGVCAGFSSVEELRAETSNELVDRYVVPVCCRERCPTCVFTQVHKSSGLIESRATLIVTPAAILSQWEREIRRHVALPEREMSDEVQGSPVRTIISKHGLKVLIYSGVKELCNQRSKSSQNAVTSSSLGIHPIHLIHPRVLADADIVLMTFDALMTDLVHSDDNPYVSANRCLRTEKRYRVLPSPLTCIKWWRVCLDEAQRVETPTATSAKMALKLASHHRWCISGTPIGRGKLDDLYGLFSFLKVGPFSNKKWFERCLRPDCCGIDDRISHLLASIIWRSTKSSDSVKRQIGIPEQIEKKVILKFSSIERHFYDRQLEATLECASDVMGKKRRTKHADDMLASHIHQLRAACCHPQVGSRGIARLKTRTSVLSMDQILDRLIDDARVKCEEAQRLAVMHTNALASIERLKVDARKFGVDSNRSDEYHLDKCCQTFLESLELADSNATPSAVVGEAILSGCQGFLGTSKIIRDGKALLEWHMREESEMAAGRELWSRFDFEGPSKKIIEIRVRPVRGLPESSAESRLGILLMPKECTFQVSSAAVGGEFVDVVSFSLPEGNGDIDCDWLSFGSFRTNRSKSWRILIKNYHKHKPLPTGEVNLLYVGLDVALLEADIASDSLQRLHVLHNGAIALTSLLERRNPRQTCTDESVVATKEKVQWMQAESRKIESLYMDAARSVHTESQRQLRIAMTHRQELEAKLVSLSPNLSHHKATHIDFWADAWWNDLLTIMHLYGTAHERISLCGRVRRELGDFAETLGGSTFAHRSFPDFHDVDGIQAGLHLRFQSSTTSCSHAICMQSVASLSAHPSEGEISNNATCGKCRADWNQTGPECNHCKLETELNKLDTRDPVITVILKSLHRWLLEIRSSGKLGSRRKHAQIDKRAECFFDVFDASERELRKGRLAWRTHFDLLSDFDEMNQCKRTIRLVGNDEDLTKLTQDELGSIVTPWDIASRAMDHGAKQAMALSTLRRSKDTLRYLKNQSKERMEEREAQDKVDDDNQKSTESSVCVVCLSPFEGERAVLACGHSFHHSPCLERLIARSGNHQTIACPLRCMTRTNRDEVMIATEKRRDDGSQSTRQVKGSWGTKVTRLLSDVMDVSDRAEKSIVFSQYEEMLDVVEEALKANGVGFVRAKTLRKIGECVKVFRSSNCTVLLLNVKNGAEGLTLVEATHVFMIEPLLNCGLDSQAISRVDRIGQRSTTYVHRYLIEDTIEEKIDSLRMKNHDDQLEDAINESRKKHDVSAGGIDGGFSHEQLQDILH